MSCQKEKRKRSKNTNNDQYDLYLQYMETDYAFRSGTINPTLEDDYLEKKWKELCSKLNALGDGPNLTTEEWRKRFLDWKYATRSKYRKLDAFRKQTGSGPQSEIKMTNLEERGLAVWGKVVVTGTPLLASFDGLPGTDDILFSNNIEDDNVNNIEIEIADIPIVFDQPINSIGDVNVNKESILPEISTNVKRPGPKKEKNKIKPQPLTQMAEKLIQATKDNFETHKNLTSTINAFAEDYIKIEKEKLQIKKMKLQFEIEKYKYENKDFKFDL